MGDVIMSGPEHRVTPDLRDVCVRCLGDLAAITRRLTNLGLEDFTVRDIAGLIGDELLTREWGAST